MKVQLMMIGLVGLIAVGAIAHEEGGRASEEVVETRTVMQWIVLGNAHMQEARNTLAHDFTEAKLAYEMALKQEPKNPEALLGMAWVENSNHDFKAGKKWALKALEQNDKLADAYSLMGDGAVELGAYDEAFDHYQSALDIKDDLSTLSRSAHLLWMTGQSQQARGLMMQAIKKGGPHPENVAWCRAELAMMLLKSGALPEAKNEAEQAVLLARTNPRALLAVGQVKIAEKDYDGAITVLKRSVGIQQTHDAMELLVKLYRRQGELVKCEMMVKDLKRFHGATVKAVADHAKAHHHGSGHSHSHMDMGSSQFAKFLADEGKELKVALNQAEMAYENFPNVYAADALAWCHFKNGDYKKAALYSRRSLMLNTPDPMLKFHAGMIAEKLGEVSMAKKYLSSALNMNPQFDLVDAEIAREAIKRMQLAQHVSAAERMKRMKEKVKD